MNHESQKEGLDWTVSVWKKYYKMMDRKDNKDNNRETLQALGHG